MANDISRRKRKKQEEYVKVFCIGNSLVLIKGKKAIPIKVDKQCVKDEIDQIIRLIKSGEPIPIIPSQIFALAVENVVGIDFAGRAYKFRKKVNHEGKQKEKTYSIHESQYYRECLEYMKVRMNFEQKRQDIKHMKEEQRKEMQLDKRKIDISFVIAYQNGRHVTRFL